MLIGEAAVKHSERIASWKNIASNDHARIQETDWFWNTIIDAYNKNKVHETMSRTLVKICGLCREEDVQLAIEEGADILGFVLANSPRKTNGVFIRMIRDKNIIPFHIPAVGVVVGKPSDEHLQLVQDGLLQALQIHDSKDGVSNPDKSFYNELRIPWYKAMQLGTLEDCDRAYVNGSPRTLFDAYSSTVAGGTGNRVDEKLITEVSRHLPLWLAGGLTPENIESVLMEHNIELVDVSSGIEDAPGVKNHDKMREFIYKAKAHHYY